MPLLEPDAERGNTLRIVAIALLFAAQAWLQLLCPLNHDASWYLHVGRGLLNGKHLYTDFIEVNPPLGMWMMVPVVWLSDAFGIPADIFYKSILLAISAASIGLVNRYMKLGSWLSQNTRQVFMAVFALAVLFLPGADFGEREHLVALLFAPWLLLRLARNRGKNVSSVEAASIGILAAIAIVLKPQSVFAPIFAEACLLWQSRRLLSLIAVENIFAGVTVLLYTAAILHFTPAFLSEMVPLGQAAYLPFYGYPAFVQVFNARWCLLFIFAAVLALRKITPAARPLAVVLLCAAFGFALSYAVQNKGFSYQVLPATIFAFAALAVVVADLWRERAKQIGLISVLVVLAFLRIAMEPQQYRANDAQFLAGISRFAPEAKSIFIASTRLSHGFPLVEDKQLQWASRLPTQWLGPYVASKWQDGPLPDDKIVRLALDSTVTDLVQAQPDIIFVDQDPDQIYVPGGKFDYLKFWSNDPRFAPLWQNYEKRGTQDKFDIFTRK